MRFFTKDPEAKARRTQELEEQHKKETAVPPPYFHTPTHALNDSLQSVPDANKGTDEQRLKEAHRQRLEREASALAAGSDTNATNIPANYWQGKPLPAQFKAPTPGALRKLALSRAALRGKKIKLPEELPTKKQSQTPVDDEGYASGNELNGKARRSRKPKVSTKGPSHEPMTARPQKDEAAEADREAELERLRNRVKELEAEQMGKQNGQGLEGRPTVLTRAPANHTSSPKPGSGGAGPQAAAAEAGLADGSQCRGSSSERWKSLSSGKDSQKKSDSTPPTSPSLTDADGVARYDWAMHWARLEARTKEERDKLPPAINPQQRLVAPAATSPPEEVEDPPCYSYPRNFTRKAPTGPEGKQKGSSRGRRSPTAGEGLADSNGSTTARDRAESEIMQTPTASDIEGFKLGFGATTASSALRPSNHSSRTVSQVDKAEAGRKQT